MGFPLVSYCLAVPKPVVAFCKLLSVIRDAFLLMLAVFGLSRFPFDDSSSSPAGPRPEDVKAQLPAVEYAQLLLLPEKPDSDSCCCIVCLERVEAADEVRRLGNCAHAFHRACIDRWIDLGRPTCPLCRADLLPRPTGRARAGLGRLLTRLLLLGTSR